MPRPSDLDLLLTCTDDGAVSDRADYCTEQAAAWLSVARRFEALALGHRSFFTGERNARGYRVAVSRVGIWTRRANAARRAAERATLTDRQRLTLAELEAADIRADIERTAAEQDGYSFSLAMAAK